MESGGFVRRDAVDGFSSYISVELGERASIAREGRRKPGNGAYMKQGV